MTEFMVIFGSEAESRPEWTRMVDVVYGSEEGELGFPSVAQWTPDHNHDWSRISIPGFANGLGLGLGLGP